MGIFAFTCPYTWLTQTILRIFLKNQEKVFEKVVLKLQKPLSVPRSFKHIFLYIWRICVLSLLNLLIIFLILSEKSF